MRILITGAGGFVGRHLSQHLLDTLPDAEIHGTTLHATESPFSKIKYHKVDLQDEPAVRRVIEQLQPAYIYHLAAQASPRRSFEIPWATLENNIRAQLNVLLACIYCRLTPRILIVGSAEIYGPLDDTPLREDTPFRPTNPYAVSKVAQDMLGLQYHISHKLPIVRARPFNHIGPGQSEGFVAVDFAIQIARIEAEQQTPTMRVGNLAAQRDFSDVRDVVRAYHLLMESGTPGEAYNIASGQAHSIQSVLDTLLSHSHKTVDVQPDPERMMPIDIPIIRGDATKLMVATGWKPTFAFEQTLLDVLNDCRERVRSSGGSST